ncbi:MAG: VIT domain-containing protein, partial [Chromatiaceae bacterium]
MRHKQRGRAGSIQSPAVFSIRAASARPLLIAGLLLVSLWPCGATQAAPVGVGSWLDQGPQAGLHLYTGDRDVSLHAPQLATQVEIDVSGVLARAKVRQRFFNPTDSWVEGVYTFPLPDDAAVDRLRMRIGSRLVEGEVQEKQQADRRYRAARAGGQAASLLQQRRPNVFTIAVANIPPGQAVDIEIAYQQRLEWREGRFSLRFPSVVAPRYIPAQRLASTRCQGVGCFTGWAADTAQVPDASAITPPVATSAPDDFQRFSLHARVVTG